MQSAGAPPPSVFAEHPLYKGTLRRDSGDNGAIIVEPPQTPRPSRKLSGERACIPVV